MGVKGFIHDPHTTSLMTKRFQKDEINMNELKMA
jgi:hypothetical protein